MAKSKTSVNLQVKVENKEDVKWMKDMSILVHYAVSCSPVTPADNSLLFNHLISKATLHQSCSSRAIKVELRWKKTGGGFMIISTTAC
jgi:hypothetical protein